MTDPHYAFIIVCLLSLIAGLMVAEHCEAASDY
jgi:hypothetical protein